MRISVMFICISLVIVAHLASSCNKSKEYTTIPDEAMLRLHIAIEAGQNVDPFQNTVINSVGFPLAIGFAEELPDFPMMVLANNIKEGKKYLTTPLATIKMQLNGNTRWLGIVTPIDSEKRAVNAMDYSELSTEFSELKLWLSDYLRMVYKDQGIEDISWGNESEIYRQLKLKQSN